MCRLIIFISWIAIIGCSPILLTPGLTNHESYQLYHRAQKGDSMYTLKYNSDSTYALCILNDNSELASEPISFLVVNIQARNKVFISINEYHKAEWLDNENLLLTSYLGVPSFSRNLNKKPESNFTEYIFNVISKKIQLRNSETEK